jgi:hypothetical protein
MDLLEELAAYEELRRLKAGYFYYMDTKDWPSWLALFAPDASLHWDTAVSTRGRAANTDGHIGRAAIEEYVVAGLKDTTSVHHGLTPLLELTSDTEARGIWAMEDIVVGPDRSITHGWGHYHETYRKIEGDWRFASVHLTRLRLEYSQL